MAGFKNREELQDLLLDESQEVIQEIIYGTGLEDMTTKQARDKLINLTNKIDTFRKLNPKEKITQITECRDFNCENYKNGKCTLARVRMAVIENELVCENEDDNSDKEMDCLVCNLGKENACPDCCRDWDSEEED